MSNNSKSLTFNQLLLGTTGLLSAAVFVIDIYIPLGTSGSMIYILFVMATYWNSKKFTIASGILATLLIFLGYRFSISSEYVIFSVINHVLAVIVVWVSVWLVNNYKASLHQARRNYRMLFQAANDEILVFQLDDHNQPEPFLEINDTACDILGYTRDELLQKSLYDIVADEKKEVNKRIENVLEHGEIVVESRHRTKEGDIIPLELSVRSFLYNERRAIISVGRDQRERRRLEQEILNASEQERQRIGRDLHDDLGQLLSVATLTAQMLEREMKSKNMQEAKKIEELAGILKTAGERSRSLSHGLIPFNVEHNGLDDALQELTSNVSKMYDIDIHYAGNQDILQTNNSTAVHIYRIAQEAINNAVKHSNATSIEVELSSSGNHITLRVKDNGRGFPESEVSKGIGMRIMNFRANMIRGDLKITSEKGKGTEIICPVPKDNF